MSGSRTTVLFLAGSGRSGTTLVNSVLGSMPGVFAGGELRYVWQRGVAENHLCSCGEPFDRCPVWARVLERLEADLGTRAADLAPVGDRLLVRLRLRAVPAMLARWRAGRPAVPVHPDDDAVAALYRAVAEVTGAGLLVDSSKLPPYGMLLDRLPDVDLLVLHVVRDPRATAYSWLRPKKSLDHGDDGALMPRVPVAKSSVLWLVWNVVTALRWGRDPRYLRVRYEDFVQDPEAAMRRVCRLAGLDPADLPFSGRARVRLLPGHVAAGNPDRHRHGDVEVRSDDRWRTGLARRDRLVVTALTLPGLLSFGYLTGGRGRSPAAGPTPVPG